MKRLPTKMYLASGLFQPSVYHALVVIFLEFFAWGLLTNPIINVLNETFPDQTFLMNGLIQGIKGMLMFLSAPLIGAMSDLWGRKPFLLLTVTFTCAPIPLMKFSPMWYFAMISISGIFAVTFSVVFAYVADVTTDEDRTAAYGLVSATFAASLVTSPAIGAYLGKMYSDNLVIALATAVAILDILFILVAVPESLPETTRPAAWGSSLTWEKADPFASLRKIGQDYLILMLCVTVFLSYLPEAGEYSCFFVYLKLVMKFSAEEVAAFIAVIGVLSVLAQTAVMSLLIKYFGSKHTIMFGLGCEMVQLAIYGFGSEMWLMWLAGTVASAGSITYPAISAFASAHAPPDQQGVAQGVITGIRGLCNGLGPALFGFIFFLFHVDLSEPVMEEPGIKKSNLTTPPPQETIVPGPPFAFGAILVILALMVAIFIPDNPHTQVPKSPTRKSSPQPVEKFDSNRSDKGRSARIHEVEPLITGMEEAS